MWIRRTFGVVLSVVGVVWILQGVNVIHGSGMSGHGGYAVLGAVILVIGLALLGSSGRRRHHHTL
ncbi:MAG: hypothetical protein WCA31_06735 [Acidimicrobiales bacterium]